MSGHEAAAPPGPATTAIARVASPYAVGVAARVGGQAISFALVVVASRHLGLDAFGVYALAWVGAVIATTFVFTGIYHAVLRTGDVEQAVDTLFWLKAAVGALGAACLGGAGLLAGGLQGSVGAALLSVAPLPLIAVPAAWNEALLVRAGRIRAASLYVLAAEATALAVAVVGLRLGFGLAALFAARYAASLAALLLTTALVRRRPHARIRAAVVHEAGRSALPLWGTTAIGMFSNYGADLVLAAFLNPAAVGAYRSGARIAMTASDVIFQPLRMLTWSRLSRLEREGDARAIRSAWCSNVALACAMLWPAMTGLGLLADEMVATVFDPSWAPAAPVLAILCLARSVAIPQAMLEPALMSMNRPGLQVRLRLAGGALLLTALLALGRFGAEAAAWAVVLSSGVTATAMLVALIRVLGLTFRHLLATFLPGLGVAAICGASVALLAPGLDGLAAADAVAIHVAAGAMIWATAMAVLVRTGMLSLPRV